MPLTFDFPLEKLYAYRGINPRPPDYDSYWQGALAEMEAIDPEIEMVPAVFKSPFADCYHLYFTGVGGARVHAKLLQPRTQAEPGPAVLMFHGYSGDSGNWIDKLGYPAAGITVAALDCRGQAGLSQDAGIVDGWTLRGHIVRGLSNALKGEPEKLLFRQIFLDTAQLAKIVMNLKTVDASRVGATGASQGGALTVACAGLMPTLKQAAPVFPFLSDYQRVWEMDQAKDAYQELQDWFRRFDPLHAREKEVFTKLGYIDVQFMAPRVQADVLWSMGLMDEICPPSTQFAGYNKITASKTLRLFHDFGHEKLPGLDDEIYQYMLQL